MGMPVNIVCVKTIGYSSAFSICFVLTGFIFIHIPQLCVGLTMTVIVLPGLVLTAF